MLAVGGGPRRRCERFAPVGIYGYDFVAQSIGASLPVKRHGWRGRGRNAFVEDDFLNAPGVAFFRIRQRVGPQNLMQGIRGVGQVDNIAHLRP